jgi:morphogenesis family protein
VSIGDLSRRMAALASMPSRLAARAADELEPELEQHFAGGTDPYGEPWTPLAPATQAGGRTAPPLAPGPMLGSLRVAPQGPSVGVTVAHPAEIHQTGWSGPRGSGPARRLVPDHGLPARWQGILSEAADDEFRKAVSR